MAFLSNKKAEENTVAADSTPNGLQEAAHAAAFAVFRR